jgi:Clp amino terminal domain, pathogenicity island component
MIIATSQPFPSFRARFARSVGRFRMKGGLAPSWDVNQRLTTAPRMNHNDIGTEHILLGILHTGGAAGQSLNGLGLTAESAEQALAGEFAKVREGRSAAA